MTFRPCCLRKFYIFFPTKQKHLTDLNETSSLNAYKRVLTNLVDTLAVRNVICDDLAKLWEVPAVPFPAAHYVVIELLIQIIQQSCRWAEE